MKKIILLTLLWVQSTMSFSQIETDTLRISRILKDSLFIEEVENPEPFQKPKILHAEPLYIDLIRDLGARKGEKEWNVGLGLTDNQNFDEYIALVEYEWAPINRLGLEVELPFSVYYPTAQNITSPGNKLNSLKLAGQYSFYVSEKNRTSMAFGYIHEFELTEFRNYGNGKIFQGNVYNPFFVAAKRWGSNLHSLIYTGPTFYKNLSMSWQINTSFHYMIPGTKNFIGLEVNQTAENKMFDTILRPQMRVGIADNLLLQTVLACKKKIIIAPAANKRESPGRKGVTTRPVSAKIMRNKIRYVQV